MSGAGRFIYAENNTTMQYETADLLFSYPDESDDIVTEGLKWHEESIWGHWYVYGAPLATRDILYSEPAFVSESSGQATTDEGPIWTIVPRREFSIAPEAERRILGYEWLMQYLYEIVYDEVQRQRVVLCQLEVRPAWSNEYDDTTGVVIDVSIEASVEQRFALWEVISSKLEALEAYMRPGDREFFTSNVSVIVNRK